MTETPRQTKSRGSVVSVFAVVVLVAIVIAILIPAYGDYDASIVAR